MRDWINIECPHCDSDFDIAVFVEEGDNGEVEHICIDGEIVCPQGCNLETVQGEVIIRCNAAMSNKVDTLNAHRNSTARVFRRIYRRY